MRSSGLKVFAPATVSNVACGFDSLGFAIHQPCDEVVVRKSANRGLQITKITGDGGKLTSDPNLNTAGISALRMLSHIGEHDVGIEMELHKRMPFGSGLGSSGASAVAGVFAVNELLGRPLERRDLLPFAIEAERIACGSAHADNVAPSLLGGFQLIRDHATADIIRLPLPSGLHVIVLHPNIEVLTSESRAILSPTVPLSDAGKQAANLGAFVAACFRSDLDLLHRSMVDYLIEPQRAHLIPHFRQLQQIALEEEAIGCSISGSGPSIFALCHNSNEAERIGEHFTRLYTDYGIEHTLYVSAINQSGVTLY
jgi:homoserine kinase